MRTATRAAATATTMRTATVIGPVTHLLLVGRHLLPRPDPRPGERDRPVGGVRARPTGTRQPTGVADLDWGEVGRNIVIVANWDRSFHGPQK